MKNTRWLFVRLNLPCNTTGESPMIPETHSAAVIAHVCMVHGSVGEYSKMFLQKLRRSNFVTPKNYLDFISTYAKLLEDKDQYILGEKRPPIACFSGMILTNEHDDVLHVYVQYRCVRFVFKFSFI